MGHITVDQQRFAGRQVIFRSDRLDPTKNLVRGFDAYERLLVSRPELQEKIVFHSRSYLSRTDLAIYREYRIEVERRVQQINERFGTEGFQPIVFEIDDDYDASLAAYHRYDVLLVNPIRDGMNLIAKEGPIVNTRDGVLVLSRGAGAFEQLCNVVIAVDPFDIDGTAVALSEALDMPPAERASRAKELKALSGEGSPPDWLAEVLGYASTR